MRIILGLALAAALIDGYFPTHTTAGLPTCSASTLHRIVFDTDAGQIKRCDGAAWQTVGDGVGGGGAPAGAVVLIVSGSCSSTLGAGWTEESSLSGKFLLGTVDASADIGGTGGSDTVTSVLNHTHAVTDPGHNHTQDAHNHGVTDPGHTHGMDEGTTDGSGTFMDRSNAAAATNTVTNSATTGVTVNNATATNQSATTGISTQNPAGGVASIDNRPAFVKVIFCRKT